MKKAIVAIFALAALFVVYSAATNNAETIEGVVLERTTYKSGHYLCNVRIFETDEIFTMPLDTPNEVKIRVGDVVRLRRRSDGRFVFVLK